MQSSDIPAKFPIPFANGAGGSYVRTIPTASQIGVHDGWASLTDGFPPLNFNPVAAGGIPPFGQDMNGLQKQITQWARWQAAGASIPWDSVFSSAIGGYPKGAIVESATTPLTRWLCIVENNTTNPDIGGAGWKMLVFGFNSAGSFGPGGSLGGVGTTAWVVPNFVTKVRARVWGGGGGGGGSQGSPSAASGGGGGAYSEGLYTVTAGATISVTAGAAGALGSAGTTLAGSSGGSSSFGAFCSAGGGGQGFGAATGGYQATAGGLGVATGGNVLNVNGTNGQAGYNIGSVGLGGGGGSAFSGSGSPPAVGTATSGSPVAGGGGGGANGGGGGAGGAGIVILEW